MRTVLFHNFKGMMLEASMGKRTPEINALPTPFWILKIN